MHQANTQSAIPHPSPISADEKYLPARAVLERYGIGMSTLDRRLSDEQLQFPQPVYFGRLRYWRLSELLAFEAQSVANR